MKLLVWLPPAATQKNSFPFNISVHVNHTFKNPEQPPKRVGSSVPLRPNWFFFFPSHKRKLRDDANWLITFRGTRGRKWALKHKNISPLYHLSTGSGVRHRNEWRLISLFNSNFPSPFLHRDIMRPKKTKETKDPPQGPSRLLKVFIFIWSTNEWNIILQHYSVTITWWCSVTFSAIRPHITQMTWERWEMLSVRCCFTAAASSSRLCFSEDDLLGRGRNNPLI